MPHTPHGARPATTFTTHPYTDDEAQVLIGELMRDLSRRYGNGDDSEGDATPVEPAEFEAPRGTFVIARRDGHPLGCVALRTVASPTDTVELKRMWVREQARGTGLGKELLAEAERRATALGARRIILETGTAQPEAIALYEAHGYQSIPAFGYYAWSPLSRCFGKDLTG
ncbi:GNAT family N-acetyltransferase [Janibacter sp. G56]|uniref:GNAT family N-acetyltransferase n=1 Tax=Janibacter sp. G56 TaxID=3418717 RepID=UPI003D0954EF